MKKSLLICLLGLLAAIQTHASTPAVNDSTVILKWLDNHKTTQPVGVSWGVPWPKGTVKKNQVFTLSGTDQSNIALQSWPLAYWPDGSLKWSGFAAVIGPGTGPLTLRKIKGKLSSVVNPILVKENNKEVRINSGLLQCVISKTGSNLIDSLIVENRLVGFNGRLECYVQTCADDGLNSPAKQKYVSKITKVTVEQTGPVRAVVRIQGEVQSQNSDRSWLPFSIRTYFYAGSAAVRFINTITYNGNEQADFIKGLGMIFSVPMREEMQNRHVRFAGEGNGIWAEPICPLVGRAFFSLNGKNIFPDQLAGKAAGNLTQYDPRTQANIKDLPIWNDYRLVQNTADGFNIQKRTNIVSTWIDAAAGKRSNGLAFVGDTKGGLAVGLKDFWQSYPTSLEILNAAQKTAELRVWLWSPTSEAMDMRHYDTIAHGLNATYEDVQPGFSTAYGINRTSELTLFASANVPSNEVLSNEAQLSNQTPLLVASPEYLHSVKIFGEWSLPDRSVPGKKWIEDQLDKAIGFYEKEIDQRNWYGFWNYGDVMHSYDPTRHTWRYDIGGFAWDNTELGTDMWLWYSFLRTGRADIFKMAEAMTRHTSEVDVYHIGKFAGLGSRHNVRHWGDGSKEVRESQAPYRRFYYYLTTDERTGDMMHEVALNADIAMSLTDPLREILPKTQYPTHARVGPDWFALIGNWMTEWERTGDTQWRDKIMVGVNSFAKMPYGFFSGAQGAFGYDPATKKMYQLNDSIGYIHLSVLMGGPEVNFELTDLLQEPVWNKLWQQMCALYGAPREEVMSSLGKSVNIGTSGNNYSRLAAYVAKSSGDPKYAQRAWTQFFGDRMGSIQFDAINLEGWSVFKPLQEIPRVSTNSTSQWCLNAIEVLEMVGDKIPAENPLWNGVSVEKK
jgi:hypothetical protein